MRIFIALLSILITTSFTSAEVVRDYYAEPGLNPFKDTLNQNFSEHIDPFSGTLQLGYVDLHIPGNGGLDIKVYRTYTSLQDRLTPSVIVGARDATGIGWTIHQGRIIVPSAYESSMCSQSGNGTADDNPVIELPDGRRERLFSYTDQNTAYLVSKNFWKASCITGGMIVTSPEGTEYVMDQRDDNNDGTVNFTSFYTSQIRDLRGNTININYRNDFGNKYISEIFFGLESVVQFSYIGTTINDFLLDTVKANNQVWKYNYQLLVGGPAGTWYQLTSVVRPDNTTWQYSYYPKYSTYGQGSYSLNQVTYPFGGTITYTYKPVIFDPTETTNLTTVVGTKVTGGNGITPGTWTFNYEPAQNIAIDFDRTTINAPNGKYVYEHYGYTSKSVDTGALWTIGLLHKKEIYALDNSLLQTETNTWGNQKISGEQYRHQRVKLDVATYMPLPQQTTITRNGTSYTTDYLNYDGFGNVGRVVETANTKAGSSTEARVTNYTYYIDPAKWIIKQVKDETTSTGLVNLSGTLNSVFPAGKVEREFYSNTGLLQQETKYGLVNGSISLNGVSTKYTYTPEGDPFTVTDANNNQIKYENYYRGIAQKETHPVKVASLQNIILERVVNPEGTVQSQKNGRLFTTSFTYDDLNRLTGISFPKPLSRPVVISWSSTSKTLTRGAYNEQVSFDGFGQPTFVSRTDTTRSETESALTNYDALGQKIFESYPFSATYGSSTTGTNYQYDTLGRVTNITHPDATARSLLYLVDNKVQETNEVGNETTYQYRSYGNPSDQVLINTTQTAEGITTDITRNVFGQITAVNQGGKVRNYGYDQNYYLERVTHPEIIGDTIFGRDNVGNMMSKKVGAAVATTYSYDESNRLTNVMYNNIAPDVTYIYDDNNNIKSIDNSDGLREYTYDENDNRISNTLSVGGVVLKTDYGFNKLDQLDLITYPSSKVVSYAPDALGRSRTAIPYITNVSYYPGGIQKEINFANGVTTSQTPDIRRRIERINTGAVVDLNYIYDGIGNVKSITNNIDLAFTISNMTYDGVDRLKTATGNWGLAQFSYDTRGNLLSKTLGTNTLNYNYDATNERLLSTSGLATNSFGYDEYGNIKTNGTQTYIYTAAGDLTTVTTSASTLLNTYDGNNIRIKSSKDGKDTYYAYSDHNMLGEYEPTGTMRKEYFYLGSQQIAVVATVPDRPTTVTVTTPDTNNNYTVSWTATTGVTHYQLLETTSQSCSGGTVLYSGSNSNFNITSQTDGTYYYCVRACNDSNCSAYTFSGASCAVAGTTSAPCLPASITVPASNTSGTYSVSWGAATGTVSRYELQQDSSSDFATASTIYSGTGLSTSISPSAALCATTCTYYYRSMWFVFRSK
jgi:YD repeat-containing protein